MTNLFYSSLAIITAHIFDFFILTNIFSIHLRESADALIISFLIDPDFYSLLVSFGLVSLFYIQDCLFLPIYLTYHFAIAFMCSTYFLFISLDPLYIVWLILFLIFILPLFSWYLISIYHFMYHLWAPFFRLFSCPWVLLFSLVFRKVLL